jgi:hypothetical protein
METVAENTRLVEMIRDDVRLACQSYRHLTRELRELKDAVRQTGVYRSPNRLNQKIETYRQYIASQAARIQDICYDARGGMEADDRRNWSGLPRHWVWGSTCFWCTRDYDRQISVTLSAEVYDAYGATTSWWQLQVWDRGGHPVNMKMRSQFNRGLGVRQIMRLVNSEIARGGVA